MSDNYLYANKRVSNEVQLLVLRLHKEGTEPIDIARTMRMHLSALLVAEPCLSCQLAGVGS